MRQGDRARTVCLQDNYKILPDSVKIVQVACLAFKDHSEESWMFEKSLLADADNSLFLVLNTLLMSKMCYLPIVSDATLRAERGGSWGGHICGTFLQQAKERSGLRAHDSGSTEDNLEREHGARPTHRSSWNGCCLILSFQGRICRSQGSPYSRG
jgi:hypothetical protein